MLSKTSRKDVAKDKASDLASAVADAAEAGREKIAPAARNVAGHLSDAADKATDAAAPHVAKAKEAVAEAAAPQVAKAKEAGADAADAAAPRVKKARKATKKAKKATKKATKNAAKDASSFKATAADRAQDAGLTTDQAHRLFSEEWMPRIQEAIAATGAAGAQAYAALPRQAQDAVETVAPQLAKKRRKKGKILIALGLLAGAGAVALYVSGQQKSGSKGTPQVTPPEVERLEVSAAEDIKDTKGTAGTAGTAKVSGSDDAVGDLEKKVDGSVSGSRRGRHAAQ